MASSTGRYACPLPYCSIHAPRPTSRGPCAEARCRKWSASVVLPTPASPVTNTAARRCSFTACSAEASTFTSESRPTTGCPHGSAVAVVSSACLTSAAKRYPRPGTVSTIPSPSTWRRSWTCVRSRLSLMAILPHTTSMISACVTSRCGLRARWRRIAKGFRRRWTSWSCFQTRSESRSMRKGGKDSMNGPRRLTPFDAERLTRVAKAQLSTTARASIRSGVSWPSVMTVSSWATSSRARFFLAPVASR
jgi:hypothetical protein